MDSRFGGFAALLLALVLVAGCTLPGATGEATKKPAKTPAQIAADQAAAAIAVCANKVLNASKVTANLDNLTGSFTVDLDALKAQFKASDCKAKLAEIAALKNSLPQGSSPEGGSLLTHAPIVGKPLSAAVAAIYRLLGQKIAAAKGCYALRAQILAAKKTQAKIDNLSASLTALNDYLDTSCTQYTTADYTSQCSLWRTEVKRTRAVLNTLQSELADLEDREHSGFVGLIGVAMIGPVFIPGLDAVGAGVASQLVKADASNNELNQDDLQQAITKTDGVIRRAKQRLNFFCKIADPTDAVAPPTQ